MAVLFINGFKQYILIYLYIYLLFDELEVEKKRTRDFLEIKVVAVILPRFCIYINKFYYSAFFLAKYYFNIQNSTSRRSIKVGKCEGRVNLNPNAVTTESSTK